MWVNVSCREEKGIENACFLGRKKQEVTCNSNEGEEAIESSNSRFIEAHKCTVVTAGTNGA